MGKRCFNAALILWLGLSSVPLTAEEPGVMVFEGARIRGNQESPNVLFVVPWRPLEKEVREIKPADLIDPQRLQPLFREEFLRLVDYYSGFENSIQAAEEIDPNEGR